VLLGELKIVVGPKHTLQMPILPLNLAEQGKLFGNKGTRLMPISLVILIGLGLHPACVW
jgi:hypothetical protein